jgi:hypothetical protein
LIGKHVGDVLAIQTAVSLDEGDLPAGHLDGIDACAAARVPGGSWTRAGKLRRKRAVGRKLVMQQNLCLSGV